MSFDVTFARPDLLWLIGALPVIVALAIWLWRRRGRNPRSEVMR